MIKMAPKCWKKRLLSKHFKSVEKSNFKAKAENSYLKHLEIICKNERGIMQPKAKTKNCMNFESIVFNKDRIEDLDEYQNDMIIDENLEADVDEQDLVICEGGQDNDNDHPDTFNDGVQEVFTSEDNVENGSKVTIDEDCQDKAANDNLIIKDDQAPHPYAVPESKYQYQAKEEFKNADFDADVFAEEFTPVQPMFEGQEDYIPEDDQRNGTDFVTWIKRVKKHNWTNVQKKNIPWKKWRTKDFEQWFAQALVYQSRIQEPKSTPLFIKSLKNTEHKRFMFGEMESSQNRRRCWKSLHFD